MAKPTIATASIFSLALLLGLATASAANAASGAVCEREMRRAARSYGVPLGVLYAVGLTETGRRDSLQPFALNIEGRAVFASSAAEAAKRVRAAQAAGRKLIDIGCMQINHYYHGDKFRSIEHMLEPAANVTYAARFLRELRDLQGTWTMAVARYHAGPNNDPAQKRYVCKVITNMVASGFGRWTPASQSFCK